MTAAAEVGAYSREELSSHGRRLAAYVSACEAALVDGDAATILASLRRLKLETAATRRVVRAAFADAVVDQSLELALPAAVTPTAPSATPPAQPNGHRPRKTRAEQQAQQLASPVAEPLAVAPSESSLAPTRGSQPSHLHKLSERDPLTLPEQPSNGVATAPAPLAVPVAKQTRPVEPPADPSSQPVQAEVLSVVASHPGVLAPDELEEHQSVGLRYAAGYLADTAAALVAAGRLKLVKGKLAPVG